MSKIENYEDKARRILCLNIHEEMTNPDARRSVLRVAQALREARMEGAAEEMRRNALTICDLRVELEQTKARSVEALEFYAIRDRCFDPKISPAKTVLKEIE